MRLANLNFILEGWHGGKVLLCVYPGHKEDLKSVTNVPCMKLSGIGPFTVFAPTNDAFRLLGPGITTTLLLGKRTIFDRCTIVE